MKALTVRKWSAWTYDTSWSLGGGGGPVAGEMGEICLFDPAHTRRSFKYAVAGLGASSSIKLTLPFKLKLELPKLRGVELAGAGAAQFFYSAGRIGIVESFDGDELAEDDVRGVATLVELAGGVVAGVSCTVMLLGMDPKWAVAGSVAGPALGPYPTLMLLSSAKAVLLMHGVNAGVQAGGGGIWCGGVVY